MMTALMVFLGLSGCSTLFIIAALAVGARRSIPAYEQASFDAAINASGAATSGSGSSFAPVYNH